MESREQGGAVGEGRQAVVSVVLANLLTILIFHFYVVKGDGGIILCELCPLIPHGTLPILRDMRNGQARTFLRRWLLS